MWRLGSVRVGAGYSMNQLFFKKRARETGGETGGGWIARV